MATKKKAPAKKKTPPAFMTKKMDMMQDKKHGKKC